MKPKYYKTTPEIREAFLKYFERNGHARITSSSLIPHNDPSLLFNVAGMVQFKDCFLGVDKRSYNRATTAQKCIRAGGKHNDLENVGYTARHHTFFEMLGNFSFGDYFKKDAIHFAWEFITKELGLPKERLRVSVHESDDESAEIWHKQEGVPLDRIVRFGEDNFWSAGDVGPCGPCTEIFWDQGKEVDGDRWLEFWNVVFMQYERLADGTMNKLPKPAVDTGMGLERMAAILQDVPSNYDTDLFSGLLRKTQEVASAHAGRKVQYRPGENDLDSAAVRVICDHLRATSFLLADGVLPSNEGRGYVLRRILRRAVRFGKRLGIEQPFLAELYPALIESMGNAYPELALRSAQVCETLTLEETKFFETLGHGLHLLEENFLKIGPSKTLSAEVVFKLYDTFGFPMDLTALIARERDLSIDEKGFHKLMEFAQERSRASWKGSGEHALPSQVKEWKNAGVLTHFSGYDSLEASAQVRASFVTPHGTWVAVDTCPLYPEGGGQVADQGEIEIAGRKLQVNDVQKPYEGATALFISGLQEPPKTGQSVRALVNPRVRRATQANHTATHLLHAALRNILGTHVEQAGSLVTSEKLRFDFSHPKSLGQSDVEKIEKWVNDAIEADVKVQTQVTSYGDAIAQGAMALFGEKYTDEVRMLKIEKFSTELCGGTHVSSTNEIRLFKIISEGAVAAGTRRVEALTHTRAIEWYRGKEKSLDRLAHLLKSSPEQVEDRVEKIQSHTRELEREIEKLKAKLASGSATDKTLRLQFKGMPCEIHVLEGADVDLLRQKADHVRTKKSDSIHIVYSHPLVIVTADTAKFKDVHAGNLLKDLAQKFGGRGGGQAQTAQGQLPNVQNPEEIKVFLEGQK